jgi:hypothetical protein
MSTTIKYTNSDYQPINEQQKELLKFYNKQFFLNNELKKVELYGPLGRTTEIILQGIAYYLSDNEDLQSIINQYKSSVKILTIYYNKQTNSFGDTYYDLISYKNEVLDFKTKLVTNALGQEIAFCEIDIETDQIKGRRKKFYGDINIYKRLSVDSRFLSVHYDDNGISDIYIYDEDYQSVGEFLSSSFSADFDWTAQPYYHNFEPMLPTGLIV